MAVARVLVYGGKGALGATCVTYFKSKDWWVASVDLFPNEEAHANVVVTKTDSWTEQNEEIQPKVEEILDGNKFDAIICVAGGWAGGSAKSKAVVKNADLMFKQSVWTSLISASIASKHLKENGMLMLTGAQPSLGATPGMLGYGMAKAAVHQLVKGLADEKGGLPSNASVLAILPAVINILSSEPDNMLAGLSAIDNHPIKEEWIMTLDTPGNRKGMPNADFNQWTPLEYVANLLFEWTQDSDVPPRGSLVKLKTQDGISSYEIHTGGLL